MKKQFQRIVKKTSIGKKYYKYKTIKRRRNQMLSLAKSLPIEKNKIIFSAFSGRLYACSPKAIYEYMIKNSNFNDYTFVWAFNKPAEKQHLFNDDRTTLVKFNSCEYFEALATSKYWIFNFKTPGYYCKRNEQLFLQCWHGTPLKKIGLDIDVDGNAATKKEDIHKSYLSDANLYDFFLSPSRYASEKFISAFGLEMLNKKNIIMEKGYPRNDSLFNRSISEIDDIKLRLGIPLEKKVILYCPTFRDNQFKSEVGHTYQLGINLLRLKEHLPKDCILMLRLHYLVSNSFDILQFSDFAIDVSDYDDINDLYLVSNALVTDYSSVFFDYISLDRPIFFYMYDLDMYKSELRDFYFDISDLPGPIIQQEKELITELKEYLSGQDKYVSKRSAFKKKYPSLDDGNATYRVVKELFAHE